MPYILHAFFHYSQEEVVSSTPSSICVNAVAYPSAYEPKYMAFVSGKSFVAFFAALAIFLLTLSHRRK